MLDQVSDQELSQAFLGTLLESPAKHEVYPTPDELWMFCTLELDIDRRKEIIDQCMRCKTSAQMLSATRELVRACGQELAQADEAPDEEDGVNLSSLKAFNLANVEFASNSTSEVPLRHNGEQHGPSPENVVIGPSRWWTKLRGYTAGATALAVAAGLAFFVTKSNQESKDKAWRGPDDSTARPLVEQHYLYENGVFSWPAESNLKRTELEITRPSGESICTLNLQTNRYRVNAQDCPGFSLTEPFFWRIKTVTVDGIERETPFHAVTNEKK